jgi:hypothetical protein
LGQQQQHVGLQSLLLLWRQRWQRQQKQQRRQLEVLPRVPLLQPKTEGAAAAAVACCAAAAQAAKAASGMMQNLLLLLLLQQQAKQRRMHLGKLQGPLLLRKGIEFATPELPGGWDVAGCSRCNGCSCGCNLQRVLEDLVLLLNEAEQPAGHAKGAGD